MRGEEMKYNALPPLKNVHLVIDTNFKQCEIDSIIFVLRIIAFESTDKIILFLLTMKKNNRKIEKHVRSKCS